MKIIFYHTQTCPQCKMVEMQLKNKHIEYESIEEIDDIIAKGIDHTPALEVDGEILFGKDIINWIKSR